LSIGLGGDGGRSVGDGDKALVKGKDGLSGQLGGFQGSGQLVLVAGLLRSSFAGFGTTGSPAWSVF